MEKLTDSIGAIPAASKTSALQMPVDVVQLQTEVPSSIAAIADRPQVKLTPRSVPKALRRHPTVALHYLNLPLTEGVVTVPGLYRIIRDRAENYQRKYNIPWFSQYPQMIIRSRAEMESEPSLSDEHLFRDVRKYAMRLAHYVWHYLNASAQVVGSLANLLVLSRLNGSSQFKTIAEAFKWSSVNSKTNMYAKFFYAKDIQEYVFGNTKVAVGESDYGATFVSIPQWITDVFGARGSHTIPITNLVLPNADKTNPLLVIDPMLKPDDDKHPDLDEAIALFKNMLRVQKEFGTFTAGADGKVIPVPRTIAPLNGSEIVISSSSLSEVQPVSGRIRSNADGVPSDYDELTRGVWDNWYFWIKYLVKNFPEFSDPNSDFVQFFTHDIPLLETGVAPSKALSIVHSAKNSIEAEQLLKLMEYKRNNSVNTATIIKWMPMMGDDPFDAENFDTNFKRYNFDSMTTAQALSYSRQFPRLTPVTFYGVLESDGSENAKPHAPLVANAAYMAGDFRDYGPTPDSPYDEAHECVIDPIGLGATLLDLASSANPDPSTTKVNVIGASIEDAKKYIQSGNGVVCEEDPTNVLTLMQPIIDTTDPFQCGFNVLISHDTVVKSDWEQFLTDYRNIPVNPALDVTKYSDELKPFAAPIPSDLSSMLINGYGAEVVQPTGAGYKLTLVQHTANRDFMSKKKHALVFIGKGIFTSPVAALISNQAGHLTSEAGPYSATANSTDDWAKIGLPWKDQPLAQAFRKSHVYAIADAPIAPDIPDAVTNTNGLENALNNMFVTKSTYGFVLFGGGYPPIDYNRMATPDMIKVSSSTRLEATSLGRLFGPNSIDRFEMGLPFGVASESILAFNGTEALARQVISFRKSKPIWFIASVSFRGGSINPKNGILSLSQKVAEILFANERDQMAALISGGVIVATGLEDTHPFWNVVGQKETPVELPSSEGLIPESNVLVEPRKQNQIKTQTITPNVSKEGNKGLEYDGRASDGTFSSSQSSNSNRSSTSSKSNSNVNKKKFWSNKGKGKDKGGSTAKEETAKTVSVADPTTPTFDKDQEQKVRDEFNPVITKSLGN